MLYVLYEDVVTQEFALRVYVVGFYEGDQYVCYFSLDDSLSEEDRVPVIPIVRTPLCHTL